METILVRAFHNTLPGLDLPATSEYPFSKEKRNELIDQIMEAGYNVCLQRVKPEGRPEYLIIWYDKWRFQQR